MIIAIGSDHAGFSLRHEIIKWLEEAGHTVRDFGCESKEACDYPDFAVPVAKSVAAGKCERGILVCGTGVGMAVAANRIKGIRAVNCSDTFTARSSREHNDTNVLTIGERVVGTGLAFQIVQAWIETDFSGDSRHTKRLDKIEALTA